jgi:hypothetical protein
MTSANSILINHFKISVSSNGEKNIDNYGNANGRFIPSSIERAIDQKLFAATGGTETEPVVIGRVIREGLTVYSIISTVVREQDQDKDFYLYLYIKGFLVDNPKYEDLSKLASWLDQQNSVPIYRSQRLYGVQELSKSDFQRQTESISDLPEVKLVVKAKVKYSFQEIDSHVSIPQSSDQNTNSIGWAFNVTTLEKAREFQYIIAANDQVYSSISNQLMSRSTQTTNSALAITTPEILTPLIIPAKRYELEIHEFSTGIVTEGNPNNWVSRRFTGGYMNATIDPIPNIVEVAISNNLFQTVGGYPNQPAIIGRVLEGKTDQWSVVAVVTACQDFEGRSLSAFRYFLAEGTENIHAIVAWLEERRRNNTLPIFNPFDTKRLGKSHKVTIETPESIPLNQEDIGWLNEPTALVTGVKLPSSLQNINDLACVKSQLNKKPISWAYNVHSLKLPERFQVIHPVNDASRNAIHLALSGNRQQPKALQASDVRLDPKILLKNLIGQSIPSDDLVIDLLEQMRERSTFNNVLSQDIAANKRYWEKVFESFDAAKGLSERLYTPQMVRLLTWKAIIFPETLPEFVNWLHDGDSNQINKNRRTVLELEEGLSRHIDEIKNNLILGVVELPINLFSQEEDSSPSVSNIAWILENSSTRLWASLKDEVITRIIERVLPIARNKTNSSNAWQDFIQLTLEQPTGWRDFYAGIRDYENNQQSNKKYIYVAEFFEQLGSGQQKNLWIRLKDFILGVSQLLILIITIILVIIFDVSFAANIPKESWLISMFAPLAGLASVSLVTRSFISAFLVGIPHIAFIRWRLCLENINQGFASGVFWVIIILAIWLIYKVLQIFKKSKVVNSEAYALAAVFYTICREPVSQDVFANAVKSTWAKKRDVQGFRIASTRTIDDSLIRFVKNIWPQGVTTIVAIVVFICAVILGTHNFFEANKWSSPFAPILSDNPNCGFRPPIPPGDWGNTRKEIKSIVDENIRAEFSEPTVISTLLDILGGEELVKNPANQGNYYYKGAIIEGQKNEKLIKNWNDIIMRYQTENAKVVRDVIVSGHLMIGDRTSTLIRQDLKVLLEGRANFEATRLEIKRLVDDKAKTLGKDKANVIQELINVLDSKNKLSDTEKADLQYNQVIEVEAKNQALKDRWIRLIYNYESRLLGDTTRATGYITSTGNTIKNLSSELEAKLRGSSGSIAPKLSESDVSLTNDIKNAEILSMIDEVERNFYGTNLDTKSREATLQAFRDILGSQDLRYPLRADRSIDPSEMERWRNSIKNYFGKSLAAGSSTYPEANLPSLTKKVTDKLK